MPGGPRGPHNPPRPPEVPGPFDGLGGSLGTCAGASKDLWGSGDSGASGDLWGSLASSGDIRGTQETSQEPRGPTKNQLFIKRSEPRPAPARGERADQRTPLTLGKPPWPHPRRPGAAGAKGPPQPMGSHRGHRAVAPHTTRLRQRMASLRRMASVATMRPTRPVGAPKPNDSPWPMASPGVAETDRVANKTCHHESRRDGRSPQGRLLFCQWH